MDDDERQRMNRDVDHCVRFIYLPFHCLWEGISHVVMTCQNEAAVYTNTY